jgi:hypothetical protein
MAVERKSQFFTGGRTTFPWDYTRGLMKTSSVILRRNFSLMELLLAVGILGLFLYICSNTLVSTLQMQELVVDEYDDQREESLGWSILYRDLAYVVGVYYHHMSLWEPPQAKGPKTSTKAANATGAKTPDPTKKKKPKGKAVANDELLIFNASPDIDEPFLEIVTSRGRLRKTKTDDDEESSGSSQFRKIKYYLSSYQGDDEYIPEGEAILRTEEIWKQPVKGKKIDTEEQEFDLDNFRRHGVIFGLANVELEIYNGTEWIEEWSSLKEGDLPIAMRISFDLENGENLETIKKVLPIPLSYMVVGEPVEDDF